MTNDTVDVDVADLESIPFSGRVREIFDASCENIAQMHDRPAALAISQRHTSVLSAESTGELEAALAAIEYTKTGDHYDTPRQRVALNRVEARVKLQLDKLETPPKCPECGGRNVVKAGKTEENCEDCAIFFVPGETDGIDRGEGVKTDGGRPAQASFGDFESGSEHSTESSEIMSENTDTDEATSTDPQVSETREPEADTDRTANADRAGNTTHAVADGGVIEPEPVAIDADEWDVSDHAGEEVLLITGIARITSAPETVNGEISGSGKTISAAEPHGGDSTVRLDAETILSGESEYRDSRYFELYTPARMEKNQRSNHAPGPQAGANRVIDAEDASAPTHWPAIKQPDDVPETCPNCDGAAAPFQVEHVQSPRCENCGQTLEEMKNDAEDSEEEAEDDEPSAVNMQTWERGGVIETPDASLLITKLSRAAGYDTVLRAQAVDEENREYLLRAPSDDGVLYVERDGQPSGVVFADEPPDYSDDEAAYVGVDEERFRTWVREEYGSDYGDDDDDRDGGIGHGGDGGGDSGTGSSGGQESDGDQETEEEKEEPPKILADGGVTGFNRPIGGLPPAGWEIEAHDIGSGERVEWAEDRESVVLQSDDREYFGVDTTGKGWIVTNVNRETAIEAAREYMERVAAAREFLEGYETGHKIDRGAGIKADGGQWDVSEPVSLDQFLPLDMANNITDGRVKERIAWVDGFGRAYADALEEVKNESPDIDRGEGIKTDGGRAELLSWEHPDDAGEDALDGRQLVELKKGVRAAIDGGGPSILTAPGDLSRDRWSHAGVGISVYMHRSGVVVLESGENRIVTDANTLDTMRDGLTGFFVDPGPAVVASDEVEQSSEGDR